MNRLRSTSGGLLNIFEHDITAEHVAERLVSCQADVSCDDALRVMRERDFDVLGVREEGLVCGYVRREELGTGKCRNYKRAFQAPELISESTPMVELLQKLGGVSRVFVLYGTRVDGIVTRGDLQKAPVRMFMFGLITLLEMNFLRIIRFYCRNGSWQKILTHSRLQKAQKLFGQRKERNEGIDLVDCLELCDERRIVLSIEEVVDAIHMEPKTINKFLESVEELRDRLAHSQDLVQGLSWPKVINLVAGIRDLLQKLEQVAT